MTGTPPRDDPATDARGTVWRAAAAAASANPQLPLPAPRRQRTAAGTTVSRSTVWAGAVGLAVAFLLMPALGGLALLALVAASAAAVTLPAAPHRPARALWLVLGCGFLAYALAAWLLLDRRMALLWSAPLWLAAAVALYRGIGKDAPRALLLPATSAALAACLLWVNLLATIGAQRTDTGQTNVFAGWPLAGHIGSLRGNIRPAGAALNEVLWLDYLVMLGVATALVMLPRPRSAAWLARWLPRLCCAMVGLHFLGTTVHMLATDG